MNQKVKQKWIEALRSGEYKQGRGFLQKEDSFCCLGVLCEVVKEEIELPIIKDGDVTRYGKEKASLFLPYDVTKFAGLSTDQSANDIQSILARSNDTENLNFNQIADLIEEQL